MLNVLLQDLFTGWLFLTMQTVIKKLYVSLADRPIKEKYSNHKRALRNEKYENRTEVAKRIR